MKQTINQSSKQAIINQQSSINNPNFQGKHVSIIGLARSGVALAKLLDDKGARVLVTDLKEECELRESLAELRGRDIECVLGGHDERCLEKADLIVVSPAVPLDIPILKTAKALGIPVMGELEIAYRLCQAPIIAVTGTKGKSTTTTLIGDILRQGKQTGASQRKFTDNSGNLETQYAIRNGFDTQAVGLSSPKDVSKPTQPKPQYATRIANYENGNSFTPIPISYNNVYVAGNIGIALSSVVRDANPNDLVIAEVSSFQLESISQFHPIVSVILNITKDHLDRHKTMTRYIKAKKRIFSNQTQQDYIVLNADDVLVKSFADETMAKPIFFSRKKSFKQLTKEIGDFTGTYIERDYIVAKVNQNIIPICHVSDIKLLGNHNLENVLAAAAVGIIFVRLTSYFRAEETIHRHPIRDAISTFQGLEHALQFVGEIDGITFINDSKATNVDSVRAALEALGNNIILIMGGYDKGNDYIPLIELVKSKVKILILLGEHTSKIRDALGAHAITYSASTMREAVSLAYSQAQKGDYVLLSPANASFDMFADYRERGNAFREAVEELATKIH